MKSAVLLIALLVGCQADPPTPVHYAAVVQRAIGSAHPAYPAHWEYLEEERPMGVSDLNALGREGWELVSVDSTPIWIFKRPYSIVRVRESQAAATSRGLR